MITWLLTKNLTKNHVMIMITVIIKNHIYKTQK